MAVDTGVSIPILRSLTTTQGYRTTLQNARKITELVGGSPLMWSEKTPIFVRKNLIIEHYKKEKQ